jgi:sulfur carrier protein
VTITVNGEAQQVADGATLDVLLDNLGVRRDGTAVALNGGVVLRADHRSTALHEGDRLEIIVAVAGG